MFINVLLLQCIFLSVAAAGGELPRVVSFDQANHHAQSQTWDITQAGDGIMYFANSSGLLSYDGTDWRTYYLPEKQVVRSVACDKDNRVFTGAYGEFGYWKRDRNGFLRYTSLSAGLTMPSARNEEIWHILTGDGWVIFQSFSVIFLYDYKEVREILPPGNLMFLQKVNDKVIVPVLNKGLYEWQGGGAFEFMQATEQLPGYRVKGMVRWKNGFQIATEENGIWEYLPEKGLVYKDTPLNRAFGNSQLNRMVALSNGALALGTVQNGLYIFNPDGTFLYHINKVNGLQNNTVLGLYEDRDGNLWVGMDKGIDVVQLSDPLRYYQDINGKVGTVYTAFAQNNILYLGTNQGLYTQKGDDYVVIPGTQGQIWEIRDFDGQILCGHNNGTFRLENSQPAWVSTVTGGWQTQTFPDDPGQLLQATYTGLVVFGKGKDGLWRFDHRVGGLLTPLKQFCFDREGAVWAVNPYKGLYRLKLNPERDSVVSLKEFTDADGLPTLFRLRLINWNNEVIIRSDTVFYQWDPSGSTLVALHSLAGQSLSGVLNICVLNDREMFFIKRNQVEWIRDRQLIRKFPLSLVTDDDKIISLGDTRRLLFGLSTGYAILDTRNLNPQESYPAPDSLGRVMITELSILGNPHLKYGNLTLAGVDNLEMRPNQNHLLFRFSAPFFSEQLQFRYRLEGFDPAWSAWQPENVREYTNLPPGPYRFTVISNFNDQEASFSFVIQPKWFQTSWAKALFIGMLGLVIFLVNRWLQFRLQRQRDVLERERERQLQDERIRNRNEQLQLDIINKSKQLANSTFSLVRKNEILFQLKDELEQIKQDLGARFPEKYYYRMLDQINRQLSDNQDWEIFETNFNLVHDEFFKKLRKEFPELTPSELRLAAYLRMNLATKEIAPLLNISIRGVENKRYRLRKKLGLDQDANLTDFLLNY